MSLCGPIFLPEYSFRIVPVCINEKKNLTDLDYFTGLWNLEEVYKLGVKMKFFVV